MITQNTEKKNLVERLLQEKKISIDEAFLLLENDYIMSTPPYIQWPLIDPLCPYTTTIDPWVQPHHPGTMPYTQPAPSWPPGGTITFDTNDSIINSHYRVTCNGSGITPPAAVSYTSNIQGAHC